MIFSPTKNRGASADGGKFREKLNGHVAADFVISRKRKQYKFAKFYESENCFDLASWRENLAKILPSDKPLVIEIGAGSALFLTALAEKFPDKYFVAVDRKSDRLWQGARMAAAKKLENISYVWSEASKLSQLFAVQSVAEIWITFPDPLAHDDYQMARAHFAAFFHDKLRPIIAANAPENFAKDLAEYRSNLNEFTAQSRRDFAKYLRKNGDGRLTSPRFLADYEKILSPGGALNFKTDNSPLFEWSLKTLADRGWRVDRFSRDLHAEIGREFAVAQIMTSYEKRYSDEFWPISFARAEKLVR